MLYRHFDKKRRLLYVGISEDALKRAKQHSVKPWGHLIARITVEHFATRTEAEAAEKAAIAAEAPIHNIAHVPQRRLALGPKPWSLATPEMIEAFATVKRSAAPPAFTGPVKPARPARVERAPIAVELDLAQHMADLQRSILERALREHHGNRTAAGRRIGLSLRQMRYRMDRLGVTVR